MPWPANRCRCRPALFDGAALNRDGNIPATVAAADAVAGAATHGLLDGAARDGDIGISAVVTAADAGTIVAALGFYGAAGDVDGGSAEGVCAAADACAVVAAVGGDVAACYLNGAGTFAVARADASSALPPVAVRMPESFSDVMVSLPVSTESSLSSLLFSLCSRPACWAVAGEGIVALERGSSCCPRPRR